MPESIWQQEKKFSLIFSPSVCKTCCCTFIHRLCLKISQDTSQPHVNKGWVFGLVQLKDFYNFYNGNLQETQKTGNSSNNLIEGKKQTGCRWTTEKSAILFCDINMVILGHHEHEFQAPFQKLPLD